MITGNQIRAARALLNITRAQLTELSGVSIATLDGIERGKRLDSRISTIEKIKNAFEGKGVVFIGDTGIDLINKG